MNGTRTSGKVLSIVVEVDCGIYLHVATLCIGKELTNNG